MPLPNGELISHQDMRCYFCKLVTFVTAYEKYECFVFKVELYLGRIWRYDWDIGKDDKVLYTIFVPYRVQSHQNKVEP